MQSPATELINFAEPSGIMVYPNPANGAMLSVRQHDLMEYSGACRLDIVNQDGMLIHSVSTSNQEIIALDISALSAGIYYLRIISGNRIHHEKITVIR
jgi:hypothetical protein